MTRTQIAATAVPVPVLMDRVLLSLFFVLATGLGAFVEVPLPFTPVPLTLQTFFVLLGATLLARGWSVGANATYLGAGAAGAAFFAGGAAGLSHLWGPTAGYLWAFVPAAALVSSLWGRCRGSASRLALLAAADLLILVSGASALALFLHLTPSQAFAMGVAPFLPGEALKVAAVAGLRPLLRR